MFPSRSVEKERASRPGSRRSGRVGLLGQLERIVVPMGEQLGHAAKRPVQFAFGMGDRNPAVAWMFVVTSIVREVTARLGRWPP